MSIPEIKAVGPSPVYDRATRITRGRGQGNLPRLLRYWRRQCRRPGCFRRCVRKLRDEPGIIQPPHRLCAWIVYQVHGHWPGSRAHRAGKSLQKVGRAYGTASPREKFSTCHIPPVAQLKRVEREIGGAMYGPLNGTKGLLDYKASRWMQTKNRAARTAISVALPGEADFFRVSPRRIGYNLLFADRPSIGGRGAGGIGRRIGGAARNPFRCPPGFERGGTFTNRSFGTCGDQVLAVPNSPVTSEIRRAARAGVADARRAISEDSNTAKPSTRLQLSRINETRINKLRGGIPPVVGRNNSKKRDGQVSKVLGAMARFDGKGQVSRLVRRDGSTVTPLVGLNKLIKQDGDDFDGAAYLTKIRNPSSTTGMNELLMFGTGARVVGFSLPDAQVTITSSKKLTRKDAANLRKKAASFSLPEVNYPLGRVIAAVEDTPGLKVEAKVKGVSEPNQKLRVRSEKGVVRVVPRWVYQLFLAKNAPKRLKDSPIFSVVEEVGGPTKEKADNAFARFDKKVIEFQGLNKISVH